MPSIRPALAVACLLSLAPGASAQQQQQPPPPPTPPPAQQQQQQEPPVRVEENVVVSATKVEQQLVNAPATITVIGPRALELAASQNYGEILRNVPGVNITQISARDVNITPRGSTSTLSTSQLAVLDGRSLYQDFFGFVMWDFMPVNLNEIKRIEVIRGPASAIWGANAVSGVVNVITKTPREMLGTSVAVGAGTFDTSTGLADDDSGTMWYLNATHAGAINDRKSDKLESVELAGRQGWKVRLRHLDDGVTEFLDRCAVGEALEHQVDITLRRPSPRDGHGLRAHPELRPRGEAARVICEALDLQLAVQPERTQHPANRHEALIGVALRLGAPRWGTARCGGRR